MTTTINRNELWFFISGIQAEKDITSCGQEAMKYKALLYSIATNLGTSEKEATELAEYVCLIGKRGFAEQKKNFTMRIWLSKILVHHCIFKICSSMFSQHGHTANSFQTVNNYLRPLRVYKIPISFRTVYILFHSIGFAESEVGQILNITPIQVRERLAKATAIIKSQHI